MRLSGVVLPLSLASAAWGQPTVAGILDNAERAELFIAQDLAFAVGAPTSTL